MAITATERGNILELVVLMFDAAPGATYLEDITAVFEANGHNMLALANTLGDTAAFQTLHPNFQTTSEWVTDFLSTVGLENDALARQVVTAMREGGDWTLDGQPDAPLTKAQTAYQAWLILDNGPVVATWAQQYQDAREIMLNKAEVSEYYSVTLGGAATNLAELQDVLAGVDETQESVDAAKDEIDDQLAQGPNLTTGIDIIDVGALRGDLATNIEGVVDGDTDGSGLDTNAGTFNPGDDITGNGNTNLNLVVVDGGEAGFMRLDTIETVNIEAGTNEWVGFNAGGWTNVGEVLLNSGVDGATVWLDNLEAGTVIGVMDITGEISASYDTDSGNLYMWLENEDEGGDGITGFATAIGDVSITGADDVEAYISNTTGVELGEVTVNLGENASFSMYFSEEGYSVGDVSVTLGGGGEVYFTGYSVSGDQTWGDVAVTVGSSSSVDFDFYDSEDGDITIGAVTVMAGDTADLEFSVWNHDTGALTVGDLSMTGGVDSEVDLWVSEIDSGDVTFGDITLVGGVDSAVNVTFSGDGSSYGEDYGQMVTLGNVTLTAGDAGTTTDMDAWSEVGLAVYSWSSVDVGDIDMTVGASGSIDVSFSYISNDVTVGNVSLMAGEASNVEFGVQEIGIPLGFPFGEDGDSDGNGSVTIGNMDIVGEDVDVWVTNSGTGTGDVTIGNMTITASGSVSVTLEDHAQTTVGNITVTAADNIDVYIEAEGATTLTVDGEDTVMTELTNITIGNVDMSVTANGNWASVSLDNGEDNNMMNVGSITAGDVNMVAQDEGQVDFFAWNRATASTTASNTGTAAGNITVGNVTMEVGSMLDLVGTAEANLRIDQNADEGIVGDVTVGDISVTVGDGFASGTLTNEATAVLDIDNYGEDGAGAMTIGDVAMAGGDFASLSFEFENSAGDLYGSTTDVSTGLLTVGDISMEGGESAYLEGYVYNYNYAESAINGGILVGDISVMAAQDSYASVSISAANGTSETGSGMEMGAVTVGDVNFTMGDNSTAELYVYQWGNFTGTEDLVMGDYTVGNISIAVSATETEDLSGGSYIEVELSRSFDDMTGFDAGSMTVGNVTLSAGDDAYVDLDIENDGSADTMGPTTIGVLSVTVGDDVVADTAQENEDRAQIEVDVYNSVSGGDIGDVTIAGLAMEVGDDYYGNIDVDISKDGYDGDVGNVSFGDITLVAGDSSSIDVDLTLNNLASDAVVGDIAVGDVMVTLGDSSTADFDDVHFYVEAGGMGDVSVGNFTVVADANAGVYFDVTFTATNSEIGNATLGDVNITVADGAAIGTESITYSVDVRGNDGVGDVTVGDWTVVAGEAVQIGYLEFGVSANSGDVGHVMVGDINIDLGVSATLGLSGENAGVSVYAGGGIDGVEVGDVTITATDGSVAIITFEANASGDSAGNLTIGDINLMVDDAGLTATYTTTSTTVTGTVTTTFTNTFTTDVGGNIAFYATLSGDAGDTLTVGDVTIEVGGTAVSDEVWVTLSNNSSGDVVIGDVSVSGEGLFVLDGASHTSADNTSFLAVNVSGTGEITIGDIDFTGYASDITLDLSWTDNGAANITGGDGNDVILGNAGANIINGGEGQDDIDISQGGDDIILTNEGESGTTAAMIDVITGFEGDDSPTGAADGDKLDFNHVAGTAGNYVEGDNDAANLAQFILDANDALNSTVMYYADYDGTNTYVAVNYGSGEADLIIALVGDHRDDLTFGNFIA